MVGKESIRQQDKSNQNEYCLNCGKENKFLTYYFEDGSADDNKDSDFEFDNWIWTDTVILIDLENEKWFPDGLSFCSDKCEEEFVSKNLLSVIKNRMNELKEKNKK